VMDTKSHADAERERVRKTGRTMQQVAVEDAALAARDAVQKRKMRGPDETARDLAIVIGAVKMNAAMFPEIDGSTLNSAIVAAVETYLADVAVLT